MITTIIFDWKQTLYSPEEAQLIPGAQAVLDYLAPQNITLYLVGKGSDDMYAEVERLGVKAYFNGVVFIEGDKHPDDFRLLTGDIDYNEVLVIGDKLSSEIAVGNLLGATTIQVKQGNFAADEPLTKNQKPNTIVNNLSELKSLLEATLHQSAEHR